MDFISGFNYLLLHFHIAGMRSCAMLTKKTWGYEGECISQSVVLNFQCLLKFPWKVWIVFERKLTGKVVPVKTKTIALSQKFSLCPLGPLSNQPEWRLLQVGTLEIPARIRRVVSLDPDTQPR